jgi:hypothetical protein
VYPVSAELSELAAAVAAAVAVAVAAAVAAAVAVARAQAAAVAMVSVPATEQCLAMVLAELSEMDLYQAQLG